MKRLDVYLYENVFFPSRDKAKEAIVLGIVSVNGKVCTKPAQQIKETDIVEIVGEKLKYVSRAGLKLEKARKEWNIEFNNKVVIDVGASTGGFTDFCLQNGAKKVYAVDVGKDQLHQSLLSNPKVINLEKTDFRTLPSLADTIDIAVCDCSFISLKLLSNKFSGILTHGKELVVLIKPQFECGKAIADKFKGVIKDEKIHNEIIKEIILHFKEKGFNLIGYCPSPILGTAGNKEFLAYFKMDKTK